MQLRDNAERYGLVSRLLHWGMALVLLWQLLSVAARVLLPDTAIDDFLWSTHRQTGFLLFVLIGFRIVWALANISRRPPSVSLAARLGHILLYVLLFAVPLLALVRQYGSGRAFEPFGIPLFSGFDGDSIAWMIQPASLAHGALGWTLFALIVGHILMAFWHRRQPGWTDVLPRMWGRN